MKIITTSITPKFDSKEIYEEAIGQSWFRFQNLVAELGQHILSYLQTYINANSHREGKTGNLANAMKLDLIAGEGMVGWGIGKIEDLNKNVPYWYLINFGGLTTIAREGRGVGGYFGTGDAPDSKYRGTGVGSQRFTQARDYFIMKPKSPIKGMNYIESTRMRLDQELQTILTFLMTHK